MGWEIERDEEYRPTRLLWSHATEMEPIPTQCPKCQSTRWQDLTCLDCWYRFGEWGVRPVLCGDGALKS